MKILISAIVCLISSGIFSQTFEVGIAGGLTDYVGEIGTKDYISPNTNHVGLLGKVNINDKFVIRGSAIYTKLSDADKDSKSGYRVQRDYSFNSELFEGSIGLEYNIIRFDAFNTSFTPYISLGLGYIYFDRLQYRNNNSVAQKFDIDQALVIPIIGGIKTNITERIKLSIELGVRFATTDNLDGSNPDYPGAKLVSYFDNSGVYSNDIYTFGGLTLTYEFYNLPLFGAGGNSKSRSRSKGKCHCPF